MRRTLVLGGPGAGKTEYLLGRVRVALQAGYAPGEIALVTFTRAAAEEARSRACREFGLEPEALPHFRTVHSLAYRELGLRRSDVISEAHLSELSDITGELYVGAEDDPDAPVAASRNADPLLTLDHYARTTQRTLREAWEDHGGPVEWRRLERFSRAYALYRSDRGVVDFTDMLTQYASAGLPPMQVRTAIVDEAQDLTNAQWAVVTAAFSGVDDLYAGGDDDQSIHHWAGAADDYFLTLPWQQHVLGVSHRLPAAIFGLGQEVLGRMERRWPKAQSPAREGGTVEWVATEDEVDLSSGSWLLLARTRAQLSRLEDLARSQGATYSIRGRSSVDPDHVQAIQSWEALRAGKRVKGSDALLALRAAGRPTPPNADLRDWTAKELAQDCSAIWHDALVRLPLTDREYYLVALRRGEKLTEPPRVRISTIHGAKGTEADSVLLMTDLTWRTWRGYELDPDSEYRVLYVGLTRAKARLVLVAAQGAYGYPL